MNSSALIMMLIANIIVTVFTVYFFLKVLKTPHKHDDPEVKSYDAT